MNEFVAAAFKLQEYQAVSIITSEVPAPSRLSSRKGLEHPVGAQLDALAAVTETNNLNFLFIATVREEQTTVRAVDVWPRPRHVVRLLPETV